LKNLSINTDDLGVICLRWKGRDIDAALGEAEAITAIARSFKGLRAARGSWSDREGKGRAVSFSVFVEVSTSEAAAAEFIQRVFQLGEAQPY